MPADSYAALRITDFRKLVLAHGALTVAREAQIVVVGWQVYEVTRDPLALGLVGLAEALPLIGVALYAGHVADKQPRRTIALAGTFGMLLSAVALLLFSLRPGLLTADTVVWIYAVIFMSGIARCFVRPANVALGAEIVPRELYSNAVAWRTSTWHLAAIIGPAAGGMIYGFRGAVAAYLTVTVLMLLALVMLAAVDKRPAPLSHEEMPIGESLRIGLRFVFSDRVILSAMTLDLFSVLFGGATALLPIFAEMMKVGPQGLGILRAAPAVGSVLIGLYIAHRPPFRRAGVSLLIAVTIFGMAMIGFAFSRNFWLSAALLFLSGAADNISVIIRSTLIQTRTPHHYLGRVSAVNQMFIGASNEIGAFESGVAARLLGVVPSVIFGGFMTLVVVALVSWWSPGLRKLREIEG